MSPRQGKKESSIAVDFVDLTQRTQADITVRLISVLEAPRIETFVRQMYFEGGDVLVCVKGLFRFVFADGEAIELHPGEMLVIYPGNYVTIQSRKVGGQLNYVILEGPGVPDYFNSFGFYDRLRMTVDPQEEAFQTILRLSNEKKRHSAVISYISDLLAAFRRQLHENGGATLNKAILGVHACLSRGEAGIQSVCSELDVSRSYLNALFLRHGLPAPGTFIRREQLRRACALLRDTKMKIADVGRAVGIASPVYFTTYVRRLTGRTPREIRNGHAK